PVACGNALVEMDWEQPRIYFTRARKTTWVLAPAPSVAMIQRRLVPSVSWAGRGSPSAPITVSPARSPKVSPPSTETELAAGLGSLLRTRPVGTGLSMATSVAAEAPLLVMSMWYTTSPPGTTLAAGSSLMLVEPSSALTSTSWKTALVIWMGLASWAAATPDTARQSVAPSSRMPEIFMTMSPVKAGYAVLLPRSGDW